MKAKYIGDLNDPDNKVPDNFTAYGMDFPKDKFVDVPAELESKFEGNAHFETKGEADKA